MPFHQSYESLKCILASKQNLNSAKDFSWLLLSVAKSTGAFNVQQFIAAAVSELVYNPRIPWRLKAQTFWIRNVKQVHQCQAMSDVFSSLCLLGRNKKKNSVSNSITVVGVKKALLLGRIFLWCLMFDNAQKILHVSNVHVNNVNIQKVNHVFWIMDKHPRKFARLW